MLEFFEIMIVDDLPELYKWGEAEKEIAFLKPLFTRVEWSGNEITITTPEMEKKLGEALSKVFVEALETLNIPNWDMNEGCGERKLYENQYRKLTYKESEKEAFVIENTEQILVAFDDLLDIIDCFLGKDNYNDELMLHKAILLATKAHKGQVRKGTGLDYLCHPMEVLEILSSMGADLNLRIAGVLHDTVEDTDVEIDEIREKFGDDVGDLVAGHTEDKSKSWQERKSATIEMLQTADTREKMLVLADKVSNLRSIYHDLHTMGEKIWERFRFPRDKQSWYYSGVQDALYDLQFVEGVKHAYWEMVRLHKDIFVDFYLAEEEGALYQKSVDGEVCVYFKSTGPMGQWVEAREVAEKAIVIPRVTAECIEDLWRV